ncbi:MAG: HHL1-like protein [Leptolyngbya sp. BL-A-14]
MTTSSGFGKTQSKPGVSKRAAARVEAVKRYDKLKAEGIPDFEVYIRIQGKKAWYPVGSIAVKRSDQINRAIFANQDDLLQGAFRLFPVLRKHQAQLEYGYRLKEFKDEPIQLAVAPSSKGNAFIQKAIAQIKAGAGSLFQRS